MLNLMFLGNTVCMSFEMVYIFFGYSVDSFQPFPIQVKSFSLKDFRVIKSIYTILQHFMIILKFLYIV